MILCTIWAYHNVPKNLHEQTLYIKTITNITAVQNFGVISNKFDVIGICNMKLCTEWITKLYNYFSVVLISPTMHLKGNQCHNFLTHYVVP